MIVDQRQKEIQKAYCKTVLAEHGELTQELYNKINDGDEAVMRKVYLEQQKRIRDKANELNDQESKKLTLSQVDSIQEVLNSLSDILRA